MAGCILRTSHRYIYKPLHTVSTGFIYTLNVPEMIVYCNKTTTHERFSHVTHELHALA